MKLTRRQLVVAATTGSAIAARALAAQAQAQTGAADYAKLARDGVQRNGDTLAKFAIPMATEPPFRFKA